jgi:hypothetical protein
MREFSPSMEAEPPHIDIDFIEGPETGNRCEGPFQLDGDQLTFCLGLVGSPRPEKFATGKESGHALEVLIRADSGRPRVSMAERYRMWKQDRRSEPTRLTSMPR